MKMTCSFSYILEGSIYSEEKKEKKCRSLKISHKFYKNSSKKSRKIKSTPAQRLNVEKLSVDGLHL